MISYEDFAKLEITIGEIVAAEVAPDSDRLLKLTVEVGEEKPRQIISAIREYFPEPEVLIGKKCPFLTNLEHRTIRGLESEGMILAAESGGTFALLDPHVDIPAGTRIS